MTPSRSSLPRCGAGESLNGEKNNARTHSQRLSSAVHIVFEQLALICHLVEGGFVARGRGEALCSRQRAAPLREPPVDGDKPGDNCSLSVGRSSAVLH